MARRVDLYTGGVGFSANARTRFDDSGACLPFISFTGKCLNRNQDRMFDIIHELITEVDFGNLTRLHQLVLEYRAGLEAAVIHNGHRLAISLASRNFSPANQLQEMWSGIHQLHTIKQVAAASAEDDLERLRANLKAIGSSLYGRENASLALIGEAAMLDKTAQPVKTLMAALAPDREHGFIPPDVQVATEVICTVKSAKREAPTAVLRFTMPKMGCSASVRTGIRISPELWPCSTGRLTSSVLEGFPKKMSKRPYCRSVRKSTNPTRRVPPPARHFTVASSA